MQSIDLNGTWRLRWADGVRGKLEHAEKDAIDEQLGFDAQVPGEVHLDLMKAGIIEDVYHHANVLKARWVEEFLWSYRRHFEAPAAATKGRAWLVFEGLDYAATILLNGVEVGRHKNFHTPCRVDVTGKLREGRNLLTVHLDAGLYDACDKPAEGWMLNYDQKLNKRHWMRKPQFQFGWDWSQRLINVGIHKPVRLEWTDEPVRIDQLVPLAELSADLQKGAVRTRLWVEGLVGGEKPRGQLTVELVGTDVKATTDVDVARGFYPYDAQLQIDNPKLWWPRGQGEPNLYTLRATLTINGNVVGEKTARIGFRHVRVRQDPHPQAGKYFIIEVNNRPIFCKGANLVPADMIFAKIDRARYETLVSRAAEANFNLLRIWGGGLYEADEFYDLCDEQGFLVWQEFIFACSRYPTTDKEFADNAKAEATYQVLRLASHASLIVWCGNNENEQGMWQWGWDRVGVILPDHGFYHIILPKILASEDPTRYYQPSSPWSPDFLPPTDDTVGDQHPWSIGFWDTDFRKYRQMICRFPNEGGILGPTSLPTVKACLPEGQQYVGSFAWQIHDNSIATWTEPSATDAMVTQWTGKNVRDLSIEEYVYWAGLVQGEGLREYCDNFRRRMFDSSAAIFWMYNDCWPCVRSWTIVDYSLRRTPAFWPVRRAMQPVHVVVAEDGDQVAVFGVNETVDAVSATLRYGLFNLSGAYPVDRDASVEMKPNASTRLASFPRSEWKDPSSSGAFAVLSRDGALLARNRLFLPFFKNLKWSPPELEVRVEKGEAVFESTSFVWGVCLDLDGSSPLPDNFFDVYPGVPYRIHWTQKAPPKVIRVGNLH